MQRIATVGAARMAQSTHRSELILMFKRNYFGMLFGKKKKKSQVMLVFEPDACRFVRFYEGFITKNCRPGFFSKIGTFLYSFRYNMYKDKAYPGA